MRGRETSIEADNDQAASTSDISIATSAFDDNANNLEANASATSPVSKNLHTAIDVPTNSDDNSENNNNKKEKVLLVDISLDKKWIAYVIESYFDTDHGEMGGQQIETTLTVRAFHETGLSSEKDRPIVETKLEKGIILDRTAYRFLSISPDGEKVAISSMDYRPLFLGSHAYVTESPLKDDGIVNFTGPLFTVYDDHMDRDWCRVYGIAHGTESQSNHLLKKGGRAVFLENSNLAIATFGYVIVYSKNDYDELYRIRVDNSNITQEYSWDDITSFSWCLTPYREAMNIDNTGLHRLQEPICSVLFCSSLLQYNIIQTFTKSYGGAEDNITFYNSLTKHSASRTRAHNNSDERYFTSLPVTQLWSLIDNGTLLTSFSSTHRSREKIYALSQDGRHFATFINAEQALSIYSVKNGIKVLEVYPRISLTSNNSSDFEVSNVQFYHSEYIAMAAITKDANSNPIRVIFEVWSCKLGVPVFYKDQEITLERNECISVKPFFYELPSATKKNTENISIASIEKGHQEEINIQSSRNIVPVLEFLKIMDAHDGLSQFKNQHIHIMGGRGKVNIFPLQHKFLREEKKIQGQQQELLTSFLNDTQFEKAETHDDLSQLKAMYMIHQTELRQMTSITIDLDFDRRVDQTPITSIVDWIEESDSGWYQLKESKNFYNTDKKMEKPMLDCDSLCYVRKIKNNTYLLRRGDRLIQLWRLSKNSVDDTNMTIRDSDVLIYTTYHKRKNQDHCLFFDDESGLKETIWLGYEKERDESTFEASKLTGEIKDFASKYYHQNFDGACRVLHYFVLEKKKVQFTNKNEKKNFMMIIEKCKLIVKQSLAEMIRNRSKYFSTEAGNISLIILMEIEEMQDVVYEILKTNKLFISEYTITHHTSINETVIGLNILTSLIQIRKFDVYNLLLNRLLLESKKIGVGGLSVINDAILFLQERQHVDVLVETCNKLSYVCVNEYNLPSASVKETISRKEKLEYRDLTTFQDLETFTCMEQLQIDHDNRVKKLVYKSRAAIWRLQRSKIDYFSLAYRGKKLKNQAFKYLTSKFRHLARNTQKIDILAAIQIHYRIIKEKIQRDYKRFKPLIPTDAVECCVVPLIHFNSYYTYEEDREIHRLKKEELHVEKAGGKISFCQESLFLSAATNIADSNIFSKGDTVLEKMLDYKWKTFVRWRFLLIYFLHLVYYVSYCVGISSSQVVFKYSLGSPITERSQIACVSLMFISNFILFFQELRQFWKSYSKISYICSLYNLVDYAALILPVIMFAALLKNKPYFDVLNSYTVLILCLHGILRIRVSRLVGITLETIIQLILSVKDVLAILLLIVCAFTHAFIALLTQKEDAYFQEQYSSNIDENSTSYENATQVSIVSDVSASNPFTNIVKSFATVWFFIYGVWDPVNDGDAGDNKAIIILSILFSLTTILIFFNLVIVYMTGKIEEIRQLGKKAWIRHYASVVGEIEELWCLKRERYNRKKHPSYIYYYATADAVKKHEESLIDEMEKLIKKLDKQFKKTKAYTTDTEDDEDFYS